MKYTLTIEGDFEKSECGKCPLGEKTQSGSSPCLHLKSGFLFIGDCPLEEVKEDTYISNKERAKAIAFDIIADAYKLEKVIRGGK